VTGGEEGGEEQVFEEETSLEDQEKTSEDQVKTDLQEEVEANVEEEVKICEGVQEVEQDLEGFEVVEEGGGEGPAEEVEDLGGLSSKEQWEDILEAEAEEEGEVAEVEQGLEVEE